VLNAYNDVINEYTRFLANPALIPSDQSNYDEIQYGYRFVTRLLHDMFVEQLGLTSGGGLLLTTTAVTSSSSSSSTDPMSTRFDIIVTYNCQQYNPETTETRLKQAFQSLVDRFTQQYVIKTYFVLPSAEEAQQPPQSTDLQPTSPTLPPDDQILMNAAMSYSFMFTIIMTAITTILVDIFVFAY